MNKKINSVLAALNEKPVAYHVAYAKVTGSAISGLLLSQIAYWWYAMDEKPFYKTNKHFAEELGLSAYEFKKAKKQLIEMKLISVQRKKVPAKSHYVLNVEKLTDEIHLRWSKYDQLDGSNTPNKSGDIRPTITENTTETTTENISISCSADAPRGDSGKTVNDMIALFEPVNPSFSRLFANKTQRASIDRLLNHWGEEKLRQIIALLEITNKRKYAPVITTPKQLEDRMGALQAYIQKQRDDNSEKSKEIIGI